MSFLSPLCALDVGSTTTRCWLEGSDTILTVPTPRSLVVRGRIRDDIALGSFLHSLIFTSDRRSLGVARPRVVASVPCCFTSVEKGGIIRALHGAGVLGTQLVLTALCAASGVGADLSSAKATVLLSCGSQYSELSLIVSGTQIVSRELSCTAHELLRHLSRRITQELQISVPPHILSALIEAKVGLQEWEQKDLHVPGKNTQTGKASEVVIPQKLLRDEIERFFAEQCEYIEREFNKLDASLLSDILEQGILLYGGFSQFSGLSLSLSSSLKIPVSVVPDPELCVIQGLKELASSITFPDFENEMEEFTVLGC